LVVDLTNRVPQAMQERFSRWPGMMPRLEGALLTRSLLRRQRAEHHQGGGSGVLFRGALPQYSQTNWTGEGGGVLSRISWSSGRSCPAAAASRGQLRVPRSVGGSLRQAIR
jgi:hypothetical protein